MLADVLLTVVLFGVYLLLLWFVDRYAPQERHRLRH
jgi:cbb3-type cytochrome oxidase subunit 3